MAQDESDVTETTPAGDVRVERGVRRKEGGVTVEYTVRGPSGESAKFRIREPLDESVALTEAGFHPEQEPRAWSVEDDAVTFEDEIPADGSFETVFGAVADEPFFSGEPIVERTDGEAESGGFLADIKRRLFGGSGTERESEPGSVTPIPESEAGAESDSGEPDGVTILADAERDLDAASAGGEDAANTRAESDAEESGGGTEDDDEGAEDSNASDEDNDMDTESGADDGAAADSEAESTDGDAVVEEAESPEGGATGAADDVTADALIAALETDEELREELREALGVPEAAGESPAKSTDVRLRHVQSRVDDLAAYTHTLEESIDQHGPPAEALSELKSETTALREDVETLREEQAGVSERVDELAETTDSLRTELAEAGERRDARLDGVESDVDGVATDLRATRDELSEELDAVRAELEDLQEMRESLTAAFGGTGAMGEATDEESRAAEPSEERRE